MKRRWNAGPKVLDLSNLDARDITCLSSQFWFLPTKAPAFPQKQVLFYVVQTVPSVLWTFQKNVLSLFAFQNPTIGARAYLNTIKTMQQCTQWNSESIELFIQDQAFSSYDLAPSPPSPTPSVSSTGDTQRRLR